MDDHYVVNLPWICAPGSPNKKNSYTVPESPDRAFQHVRVKQLSGLVPSVSSPFAKPTS